LAAAAPDTAGFCPERLTLVAASGTLIFFEDRKRKRMVRRTRTPIVPSPPVMRRPQRGSFQDERQGPGPEALGESLGFRRDFFHQGLAAAKE